MKLNRVAVGIVSALLASALAGAQVAADPVAASGIPAGNNFAPHTPAGMVIIGANVWVGDEAQGLHHYIPVDPNNVDPINTGQMIFDTNPEWSMGGGTACVPWCSVGQVAQDGSTRAYVAVYDHAKGQPFQVGGPGVWMVQFQSAFGNFSPFAGLSPVAAGLGLSGDQPTAVALGPDGELYVGFLKNGNIKRVTNPSVLNPSSQNQTVESVGGTPNGRTMRAMAFVGADLYVATDQGLAVVRNAGACFGNAGGRGNAVPVQDGFAGATHVGLASDGVSKLYFSVNGAGVFRYRSPCGAGFIRIRLCRRAHQYPHARRLREPLDRRRYHRRHAELHREAVARLSRFAHLNSVNGVTSRSPAAERNRCRVIRPYKDHRRHRFYRSDYAFSWLVNAAP